LDPEYRRWLACSECYPTVPSVCTKN
jgi:hypothetical protein